VCNLYSALCKTATAMEIYGTTELPIRETQNPPSPKFLYYFHLHFPAVCVCSILLFNLAFSSMLLFNLKRVQSCCSCSILLFLFNLVFFATNSCSPPCWSPLSRLAGRSGCCSISCSPLLLIAGPCGCWVVG
jgi:hypothetical protein